MKKRILPLALALTLILALIPSALLPAAAAETMPPIGFEDGTRNGFAGRGGNETLIVTTEQARSGSRSLLVTGRTLNWNGAALRVEPYIERGNSYEVTAWVRLKTPASTTLQLMTQFKHGGTEQYHRIDAKTANANGWTELKGSFRYDSAGIDLSNVSIFIEAPDSATAEFYIDDVSFAEYIDPRIAKIAAAARLPSLKDAYKDHFFMGKGGLTDYRVSDIYIPFYQRHFNILTLGAYPGVLASETGEYSFSEIDRIEGIVTAANNLAHGHVLVWHEASPHWLFKNADGSPLTRAEAKANMENHINKVAGYYAGKVYSWDVVNEAIDFWGDYNGNWKDALRKKNTGNDFWSSHWYLAYENGADKSKGESGADFIYDAFVLARKADPKAKLIYNDFNLDNQDKASAVADMINALNEQWKTDPRNTEPNRPLIEIIGDQAHYGPWTDLANVEKTLQRFAALGLEISITELDVTVFHGSDRDKGLIPTQIHYQQQAEFYAKLMLLYKKYSNHIGRVTFWGIEDTDSWLVWGYPLLFSDFLPKLSYFAVIDPEGYLAGNYDTEAKRQAWLEANSLPAASSGTQATPYPNVGVTLDGVKVPVEVYGINGNIYLRLSDLAIAVGINASWDGAVYLDTTKPAGSSTPGAMPTEPVEATLYPDIKVYLDGTEIPVNVYGIDGSTILALGDVARALNLNPSWENGTAVLTQAGS